MKIICDIPSEALAPETVLHHWKASTDGYSTVDGRMDVIGWDGSPDVVRYYRAPAVIIIIYVGNYLFQL